MLAYVTRERDGRKDLLVFDHRDQPDAGTQVPAGRLEHLHGGFGVMSDDAMAGIYGNLVLRVLWWVAPGWIV